MRRTHTYTDQVFKVNFGNILYFSAPQADWKQENESAPDYIKNKPVFVAGDNITLQEEDNKIIISADGSVIPDEPDTPDTPDEPDVPDEPVEPDEPVIPENTVVENIVKNEIPMYFGYIDESDEAVAFQTLDGKTAAHTENGFYIIADEGQISQAGYQIVFEPSPNGLDQIIYFPKEVKIINAYQYQPALNQWLTIGFDGTYWVEIGEENKIVGDSEMTYIKYRYNSELMGDPIVIEEYWRFEMEV